MISCNAHELGHLVMHGAYDTPTGREREWEANRFAAAWLMPEADVLASGLRNASVDRIIEAKGRWGVSAMALTHRLHELGVISDWAYTSACRRLSQLGYRRGEPDRDPAPRESSQVLDKAFALLRDHGITTTAIARDLTIHPEALRELVFGLVLTPVDGGSAGSGRREGSRLTVIDGGRRRRS
ncbi:ImmA/IrrE family metallo-endopeptidase [Nocardioides sp. Bht2]|uniref:ImmA/IrrE family metallo-endopeptidase n=1 Tax=Nocardioides sp. Bht2 TaxID=3392297 RepID=UPI0039B66CB3